MNDFTHHPKFIQSALHEHGSSGSVQFDLELRTSSHHFEPSIDRRENIVLRLFHLCDHIGVRDLRGDNLVDFVFICGAHRWTRRLLRREEPLDEHDLALAIQGAGVPALRGMLRHRNRELRR